MSAAAAPISAPRIDPALPPWVGRRAADFLAQAPFHVWAGLELVALEPGRAELGFVAAGPLLVPGTAKGGDYVHGGILNALLEPAALFALLGDLQESETAVTIDIHVQHMRPVPKGARVRLVGRLKRRGRNLAFLEAEALVDGAVCTAAQITKTIQVKGS